MSIEGPQNFEEPVQSPEQPTEPEKPETSVETPAQRFEEQFAKREFFETAGGTSEVVDITPEKLKDEVPVFLAQAWACNAELYKEALRTLSEEERRVVTLNHPRQGGDMEAHSSEEERQKYPEGKLRKALDILEVMEQKNLAQVDAIAHSEGAIHLVIAATLHPEKFRNIVFFGPAGLIGKENFLRLAQGFAAQGKRPDSLRNMPITEREKEDGKKVMDSLVTYLKGNPMRALKETVEIAQTQIHDMIRYLHDKGIGIVVASGIEDPVFPIDQMKKIATFDKIDGFLTLPGNHGLEEKVGMKQISNMLSALQSQQEHSVDGKKPDLLQEFM